MDANQRQDFRDWAEAQPDHLSYTRVRSFLADYLDVKKSKAELCMAQMQNDDEIKIIALKGKSNSGRRIFLKPLPPLTEENIRSVWDGSTQSYADPSRVARVVHDRTGHSVDDIKGFMEQLSSEGAAEINRSGFRWKA